MNGRTWKNQNPTTYGKIKSRLLAIGGTETETKNQHELWRIKIADSVFIAFKTGTLYHTPSNSNSAEVITACQEIDATTGSGYIPPSRDYVIGLDETGKGEIAGPIVMTGVLFPRDLFEEFVRLVGPADTKKQHPFAYWAAIYNKLDRYGGKGFSFAAEIVSPKLIDEYNVNRLLDLFYQRIILNLLKSISTGNCRIVLDDYGAGEDLKKLKGGDKNEILILPKAEDQFIEAKVASLVSKKIREGILENINQLPEFRFDKLSIGNGNISNPQTTSWLSKWHESDKPWPWFIKKSFKTVKELEEKQGIKADYPDKIKKRFPNLRNDLLHPNFVQHFYERNSKLNLSAVKCGSCNKIQHTILFDLKQITCQSCSKPMDDLKLTLRFYCGSLIVDPGILKQKTVAKDLVSNAFFENYRVIIPWTPSSKQDPQLIEGDKELKRNESLGRLDLEYFKVNNGSGSLNLQIIKRAIDSNSIVITSSPQDYQSGSSGFVSSHENNLVDLAVNKKVLACIIC